MSLMTGSYFRGREFAAKDGRAFLKEGGDGLLVIGRVMGLALEASRKIERLVERAGARLLQQLLAGRAAEISDFGRSIHLAGVPINDAGKRQIGDLVVMRDITALESTFQWSMIAVILISLLAAGVVLAVRWWALRA